MTELILKIYHYLCVHRAVRWVSLLSTTAILAILVSTLNYKEDISDFLPLDSNHQTALQVYQDISGANQLITIFQYQDSTLASPDSMVAAIDAFVQQVEERDSAHWITNIMSRVDLEEMSELTDFIYSNIPYFLTEADYLRMDSLLSQPDEYIPRQLLQDKQMLLFPTGGILADNIQRDPLNIFTPVVAQLQRTGSNQMKYEMYDGCIFSPDMQRAIVIISSPFGASETENNAKLLELLGQCARQVQQTSPHIDIHFTGGPAIAVGNAQQIKSDSLVSVGLAVVLILALLLFTFRNIRNLSLIAFSIAWGWLFALGGLALVHDEVSIIVIGISSVILGIAVNYPLHFIAHLSHTPEKRRALREIVMPLVVGNITTVGAFLALVPLQSIALRDLGLFSSFLLIGTILFVLLFLPHLSAVHQQAKHTFLDRIGDVSLENKPRLVGLVIALTLLWGYFSFQTSFDSNISHINFMTEEQRADMDYFSRQMMQSGNGTTIYAVSSDSTMDGALDKSLHLQTHIKNLLDEGKVLSHAGCSQFLVSREEQQRRLNRWNQFISKYGNSLPALLQSEGAKAGFAADSFDDFLAILDARYTVQDASYFRPLSQSIFASNLSTDSTRKAFHVVDVLTTDSAQVTSVKENLAQKGIYSFDVASMNSTIANHLSDDFNYIGWACGCIVFFFLWLSLGSIELAILSFIPMAVSWVWILGIMGCFNIQFNIVNIILATFIFGQGDDYTIFMTEGASYEYAYRRKMLSSYKHSIIVSALIMFIGIGTLIFAKHPALHSLAEVTIAGMFSVVLMAYIFPPLIFKLLVQGKQGFRTRPLSLIPVLRMIACKAMRFNLRSIPGIQFEVRSSLKDSEGQPIAIVYQPLSRWDKDILRMVLKEILKQSPQAILLPLTEENHALLEAAERDIVPLVLHGTDHIFPSDSFGAYAGLVTVSFLPRIPKEKLQEMAASTVSATSYLQNLLKDEYFALARQVETADYFRTFVLDRYRYKGTEIFSEVKRCLRNYREPQPTNNGRIVFEHCGYGEQALIYALSHPDIEVEAMEDDADKVVVAQYSAEGIAPNLRIVSSTSQQPCPQ